MKVVTILISVVQKGGKRKKKQDGEWPGKGQQTRRLVLHCWSFLGLAGAGVSGISCLPISFILVVVSLPYNKRCQLCWEMPVSQETTGKPQLMN